MNKELIDTLMQVNIIIKENPNQVSKKKFKIKIEEKILDILIQQMEGEKIKKPFEKMTSHLGISKTQYIAILHFEEFYKSRKNAGLNLIEKNASLAMAKQLFTCWD